MSNTQQPLDYAVRQQCLDATRSFSVRAPAGSGKTELLTQRVLVLLAKVQNPEEILSITFTRKAAAEMLDRLLGNLRWATTAAEPESGYKQHTWRLAQAALAQDREQGWQLLDNPNRLRIQTIDGLCSRLTQSLPIESGLGAAPEITAEAFPLYQQAVERLLSSLNDQDEIADALALLLGHLDNQVDRLQTLLINMLQRRDQWLPWLGYGANIAEAKQHLEDAVNQVLVDELSRLRQDLQLFASDLLRHVDFAANHLEPDTKLTELKACLGITALPGIQASDLTLWKGIRSLLLTNEGEWRKAPNKAQGFPAGANKEEKAFFKERKDEIKALISELSEVEGLDLRLARISILPQDQYADNQWQLLDALTQILPQLVAELLLCFKEAGAVDFTEITQRALIALGDEEQPTELSLKLDYQIQHILVDEFQDTSTPQIRLLEKLTQGWQSGDGKTLFIVGDGMQSCYGFRDANVGLFLDAREHGIGDVQMTAADLSVNFRSQQGIVDWVNDTFAPAFPQQDDISRGAVQYESSTAFNGTDDDFEISLTGFLDYPDRQAEAEKVCQLVQDALAKFPEQRVAILVRSRPHLRQILPVLRQAGLKWQATDLDTLASRMSVIDLVSLLQAWINPTDRIAWLAVLRAPWCGLSNEDLLAVAGFERQAVPIWSSLVELATGEPSASRLSEEGQQRINSIVSVFSRAYQHRGRMALRDEVEMLWRALQGPELLQNTSELADIERVLSLIDQHDQCGFLDSQALFQRELNSLYATPDSDADPRIQVMTIHKSKGLEFETVILAGLDRSGRPNDKELLLWQQRINQHGGEDLLISPIAATGADEDSLYRFLQEEQKLKERMEGTRLLYVGATRAINRLHIVSHLKTDSRSGNPKAPSSSSLLAAIWPSVSEQFQFIPAPVNTEEEITAPKKQSIRRLAVPPYTSALLPTQEDSTITNHIESGGNRPEPQWNLPARHMGTLLHRILRQWVLNPDRYRHQPLARFHPLWQQQLVELGLSRLTANELVTSIDQQLTQVMNDQVHQWVFDHRQRDSACELPLTAVIGRQARNLIVDRTFIDADDVRWIIDYKTVSVDKMGTEDRQALVKQEVESYRQQLATYRQAFAALEPQRVIRTALYFTDFGHLEIVVA